MTTRNSQPGTAPAHPAQSVPRISTEVDWSNLQLAPEEAFLLTRVDGVQDLHAVASASGLSPQAAMVVLAGLATEGLIQLPEETKEALRRFLSQFSARPDAAPPDVRRLMSRPWSAVGRSMSSLDGVRPPTPEAVAGGLSTATSSHPLRPFGVSQPGTIPAGGGGGGGGAGNRMGQPLFLMVDDAEMPATPSRESGDHSHGPGAGGHPLPTWPDAGHHGHAGSMPGGVSGHGVSGAGLRPFDDGAGSGVSGAMGGVDGGASGPSGARVRSAVDELPTSPEGLPVGLLAGRLSQGAGAPTSNPPLASVRHSSEFSTSSPRLAAVGGVAPVPLSVAGITAVPPPLPSASHPPLSAASSPTSHPPLFGAPSAAAPTSHPPTSSARMVTDFPTSSPRIAAAPTSYPPTSSARMVTDFPTSSPRLAAVAPFAEPGVPPPSAVQPPPLPPPSVVQPPPLPPSSPEVSGGGGGVAASGGFRAALEGALAGAQASGASLRQSARIGAETVNTGPVKPAAAWTITKPEGSLKNTPFFDVALEIGLKQRTGVLTVENSKIHKKLFFRAGVLCSVQSITVVEDETLTALLRRYGKIDESKQARALRIMTTKQQKMGEILIEMGAITRDDLKAALKMQTREKFLSVFGWQDGGYKFDTLTDLPPDRLTHAVDILPLVFQGIKDKSDYSMAKARVDPLALQFLHKVTPVPPILAKLKLDEKEKKLYDQVINGARRTRDVIAASPMTITQTYRALMAMIAIGIVKSEQAADLDAIEHPDAKTNRLLGRVNTGKYPDMLDVHWTANSERVRAAYQRNMAEIEALKKDARLSEASHPKLAEIESKYKEALHVLTTEPDRHGFLVSTYGHQVMQQSADLQYARGQALVMQQNKDEVLECMRCCFDLMPQSTLYRAAFAMALAWKGGVDNMNRAMRYLGELETMDVSDETWVMMGYAYRHANRYNEAVQCWNRALKKNPNNSEAQRLINLGRREQVM